MGYLGRSITKRQSNWACPKMGHGTPGNIRVRVCGQTQGVPWDEMEWGSRFSSKAERGMYSM